MTPTPTARYRRVCPRVWRDEKFATLTPVQKLVFLYAITAQSNRVGLFRFSPAMACEDLGLPIDEFREAFRAVREAFGWGWDEPNRVLFLPNWWRYNPPENPNTLKGAFADLAELPRTSLSDRFAQVTVPLIERFKVPLPDGFGNHTPNVPGGLAKPYPQPCPNQEQEQEQEQDEDSSEPAKPPASEPTVATASKTKAKNPTTPPADAGEILLTFPTVGAGGDSWPLYASRLDEWRAAFPGIDPLAEARKALAWINANPAKRKTPAGMPKFLVNWFGRAQNDAGRTGAANGPHRGPSTHPGYDVLPGEAKPVTVAPPMRLPTPSVNGKAVRA
jgi:hypothetical protein